MASEPTEAPTDPPDAAEPDVEPLLYPADGVPDLSTSTDEIIQQAHAADVVEGEAPVVQAGPA